MSVESHVKELEKKHRALDKSIAEEQRTPGANDLKIAEMKRKKLRLKEEMGRLSAAS